MSTVQQKIERCSFSIFFFHRVFLQLFLQPSHIPKHIPLEHSRSSDQTTKQRPCEPTAQDILASQIQPADRGFRAELHSKLRAEPVHMVINPVYFPAGCRDIIPANRKPNYCPVFKPIHTYTFGQSGSVRCASKLLKQLPIEYRKPKPRKLAWPITTDMNNAKSNHNSKCQMWFQAELQAGGKGMTWGCP